MNCASRARWCPEATRPCFGAKCPAPSETTSPSPPGCRTLPSTFTRPAMEVRLKKNTCLPTLRFFSELRAVAAGQTMGGRKIYRAPLYGRRHHIRGHKFWTESEPQLISAGHFLLGPETCIIWVGGLFIWVGCFFMQARDDKGGNWATTLGADFYPRCSQPFDWKGFADDIKCFGVEIDAFH